MFVLDFSRRNKLTRLRKLCKKMRNPSIHAQDGITFRLGRKPKISHPFLLNGNLNQCLHGYVLVARLLCQTIFLVQLSLLFLLERKRKGCQECSKQRNTPTPLTPPVEKVNVRAQVVGCFDIIALILLRYFFKLNKTNKILCTPNQWW